MRQETDLLHYQDTELYIENVALNAIAKQFGTPCYIYSNTAICANWRAFDRAFQSIPHQIYYAVKANSNIAILQLLAKLQSGFDIVSVGELERVLTAQGDPQTIVFSGIGKTSAEIIRAIEANIFCFDVESEPELIRLQHIAQQINRQINIAIRINPDVDPKTHAYISTGRSHNKFGIDSSEVIPLCQRLPELPNLHLIGIASHIGSQITELTPFLLAMDRLLGIYQQLLAINMPISHINIGGGLGIIYHQEQPPAIEQYANAIQEKLAGFPLKLMIEPGRAIVGNAGILLTRVEYLKHTPHGNFAIVDAGMNDLIRPALYDAWHNIKPVAQHDIKKQRYDIAGPVCESADFLGKDRELALKEGDLLAIESAGAYGFSMSSNYNSRCKAAEVLVDKADVRLIRRRETIADLFAAENGL